MKAHIIENNKVVNTIEVESLDFMLNLIDGSTGSIGWDYIDGVLIEPEVIVQIPETITPRQARLILLQYELLDDIELLIKDNRAIQIWWEYSTDIQRNNDQLLECATLAGLTDEQLDTMFIEASKL